METPIQIATRKFKSKEYFYFKGIIQNNPDFILVGGNIWFAQAARECDLEALGLLVELGFDMNRSDEFWGAPLANAASYGSLEVVEWMLDHGAVIDVSSINSNPLFSAIQSGHSELVKFFVELGVDTKLVYPCGRDAIAFARIWDLKEIIEILGGDPNQKREPWVNTTLPDLTGKKLTDNELNMIEDELNVKFPDYYRQFLMNNFPIDLYHENCKDNDDWAWLSADYPLFHTARSIIAYNCEDPKEKVKTRIYKEYIAIGTNGGGDFYCLKDGGDGRVYFYDHELEEINDLNISFKDFIDEQIEARLEDIEYEFEQSQR